MSGDALGGLLRSRSGFFGVRGAGFADRCTWHFPSRYPIGHHRGAVVRRNRSPSPQGSVLLTVQILLAFALGTALLVPAWKIVVRLHRDEADDQDKTVFIFLLMGLVFVAAFLRWWLVPWIQITFG